MKRLVTAALYLIVALILAASIEHLAWTFGTVERTVVLGWLSAIAIDAGIAILPRLMQTRRRARRSVALLWGGEAALLSISAAANLYHALAVEAGSVEWGALGSLHPLAYVKAALLSGALPFLLLILSEIVSADDADVAERLERVAERERRKAEAEAQKAEQAAQPVGYTCECGRKFATVNALSAHKRVHKEAKK